MDEFLENERSGPVIVILQMCKIKSFNGKFGISNAYNGTKLLINPDIKEVADYKERLEIGTNSSSQVVSNMSARAAISVGDDLLQTPMMTISDLMEATEDCLGSVLAEVIEVDTENGWYYQACKRCHRKVEKNGSKFLCNNCEEFVVAVPWFKVQVQVIDQTGSTTFMMFENIVTQILGKPASSLIKMLDKPNASSNIPPEFDSIINKTFLFKVQFNRKWQNYTIKRMSNDEDLIKQFQVLHSLKEYDEDKFADLENSSSLQLNDDVKLNEAADSNMNVDMSAQTDALDETEITPSSKAAGKRSADVIGISFPFDDSGTQASSTKIPKIFEFKKESSE